MNKPTESLGYVCKATKQRHNAKGVLYRHRWANGYQDLIYKDHAAARASAAAKGARYIGPKIEG